MRNEPLCGAAKFLLAILLAWPVTGMLGAQTVGGTLPVRLGDLASVPVIQPTAVSQAPFVFECPESLDAVSTGLAVPSGWTFVPGKNRFAFARTSVFQGYPFELAELVPDEETETRNGKTRKTMVAEWTFPVGTEIWIGCSYVGTSSLFGVQAPIGAVRCSTSMQRQGTRWEHDRRVVCDTSVKPMRASSADGSTRERSANANDYLIAPGLSVGRIRLGMSKKEVIALLGKPDNESNDSTMVYAPKSLNETEILFVTDKAIQISFRSPRYAGRAGVSTANFTEKAYGDGFKRFRISWRFENLKYSCKSGGLTFYNLNADSPDGNADYPAQFVGIVHAGGDPVKQPLYLIGEKNGGWKEWDGRLPQ